MKYILLLATILFFGCGDKNKSAPNPADQVKHLNALLDDWHLAASRADSDKFFGAMTDDAIYIGTDATENWVKKDFIVWSKPFFDRGKAWSFTRLERNIYFDKSGNTAWFDELLNTQMKICRGSGVLVKENSTWKIAHYVLSMTIPNDLSDKVIDIKAAAEDEIIKKY